MAASLNRPDGNVTGVVFITESLGAKRLELLRELVPAPAVVGMLMNPNTGETEAERKEVEAANCAWHGTLLILAAHAGFQLREARARRVYPITGRLEKRT
jgi:putative tryptophan/tyrosine transport system substrate-binding protein